MKEQNNPQDGAGSGISPALSNATSPSFKTTAQSSGTSSSSRLSRRSALKYLGMSALGAVTVFSGIGCSKTTKAEVENAKVTGVTKKKDKALGAEVSMLGFGCMRLPLKNEADKAGIDEELAMEMIDYAYKNGVNYFDTAWFYHQGMSEPFVGKALKRYPRESFHLATKMPVAPINDPDPNGLIKSTEPLARAKEIFELQLKRCQVDYVDFYLLHSLRSLEQFQKVFIEQKVLDYLLTEKANGRIKRLGFSFHGANEELPKIADQHKWDFAMIQINYYDWEQDTSNAKFLYDELEKRGIQTVAMEPVRGGMLAQLTPAACEVLQDAEPDHSVASWAIRWCGSLPNMMTVLSGMSTMEHVEDNVKSMSDFKPLNGSQMQVIASALKEHRKTEPIPCTLCDYCVSPPCSAGIDISAVFAVYNECVSEGNLPDIALGRGSDKSKPNPDLERQKRAFMAKMSKIPKQQQPVMCTKCDLCLAKCPQNIKISEKMQQISDLMKAIG